MKSKLLSYFLFLFPVLAQCQILYSEVYEKSKYPTVYSDELADRAYLRKGDELLVIKDREKSFFFQKFNLITLKVISSNTPPYSTGNARNYSTVNFGGKDYLIFERQVSKPRGPGSDGTWKNVMQEIDFDSCMLKGNEVEIFHSENIFSDSSSLLRWDFWGEEKKNKDGVYESTLFISIFDNTPLKKSIRTPFLTRKILKSAQLFKGVDGNIVCIGTYGERDKSGTTLEGFFTCNIKDDKPTDLKYTSFLESIAKLNLNDRDPGYVTRINLDKIYPCPDGGALLLFEYWAKGSKAFIHYVLIKINNENEIEWCKDYPKWENEDVTFYDDPYQLGEWFRKSFVRNNKLYILDVKHRRREGVNYLSFDSRGKALFPDVSYLRMYEIDTENGNSKAHFFQLDRELKGYNFLPSYFYLIDETSIIFEGYSKKDEILVKIPIKE